MDSNKSDMFAANAHRMQVVMNRLSEVLRVGYKNIQQIEQPLLALSRGIDFSVANGEVPSKAPELSLLVKQICQRKGDGLMLPLIMVLMVSVKNACKLGWFSANDTKEIIDLYKEISTSFCLPGNIDDELNPSNPHIQKIMERFYPHLSLGNILACLEVKPGYGAYLVAFHISKNAGFSPQEKIRLFVAQTDNTETSSCLISPQQVNFLLNGRGVIGRVNNATMETGPQIPTNVTAMLKFGTNLLQAVGHFSGNYVIAIAFMDVTSLSSPDLKGYVQLGATSQISDSDSDVIVGPSRVSLNCPISCKRIKKPVKGHSCKHVQCFDFDNFVEINSRRPSWRCPHCNQHISFLDIRLDQNMVKVLSEVRDNVDHVIISPDGSWKDASKSDGHVDGSGYTDVNQQQGSELRGIGSPSADTSGILDLTMEDDMMDMDHISDTEDRKPSQVDLLNSNGSNVNMHTEFNDSNHQNADTQMDDIWSGLDLPGYNLEPSDDRFGNHLTTDTFHHSDRAPAINQGRGFHCHSSSLVPVDAPVQQSQVNSVMDNQYVRLSPGPANRTPTAVQALPATSGTPSSRLMSTSMISSSMSSRSLMNQLHLPEMTSYHSQQQSIAMNRDATQFNNALNSASASGSLFSNIHNMSSEHQQQQQQRLRQLQQQYYLQRPSQSPHFSQRQYQQASVDIGARNSSSTGNIPTLNTTSRPASQPLRHQQPSTYQNQTSRPGASFPFNAGAPGMSVQQPRGPVQQVSRAEHLVNLSADSNLRPAGRMRGSLTGRAYEDARNLFLSPTMPPTRAPRPPTDLTSPPPGVPPELHEMITNLSVPDSSAPSS
ncbi:unnamed protein product [Rhodiola kirilowii]